MNDFDDAHVLRQEILGLFDRIQKIRREIASIRKPGDTQDRFATMSDELDAIVESTECATNSIMENVESIDELILAIRDSVSDPEAAARLDQIPEHIGAIFEACSFQDITGQRITKVVKTLQYIEKRVNALIEVWGESALSSVEPRDEQDTLAPDDERRLLNGPQLSGHGASQSDVDAIMGKGQSPGSAARKTAGADKPASAPPSPDGAATPKPTAPSVARQGAGKPPKPAPKGPDAKDGKDAKAKEGGGGLDQNDIDKLFG